MSQDHLHDGPEQPHRQTIAPVVALALNQAKFDAAYVYGAETGQSDPDELVLFASVEPVGPEKLDTSTKVAPYSAGIHRNRTTPVVLRDGAWRDRRFAELPEFRTNQFEGVVSIPLIANGSTVGIVNYCRRY